MTMECGGKSVLFVTLDSCRYDTFIRSNTPNLDTVGEARRAFAPGNFTYASHMAMFMGFTPGDPCTNRSFINPKYGKIFRMASGGIKGEGSEFLLLDGENVVDGFKRQGYRTIGSGAVGWFNPATPTSQGLIKHFDDFYYPGDTFSLNKQLQWLFERLESANSPVFAFLNIGETHVPYYFEGAGWSADENPCVPFSTNNDKEKCEIRQRLALEYVDEKLAPLLTLFGESTVIVCADHGDCWGEDGLWEHGIYHQKVMEVPLIYRLSEALLVSE